MNGDVVIGGYLVFNSEQVSRIKSCFVRIAKNGEKITSLMKSSVEDYFEAGEILFKAVLELPCKVNYKMLADSTGITPIQVSNALKIYKYFKDAPELMDNLTMKDAVRLICGKEKADGKEEKQKITWNQDAGQMEFDWEQVFQKPTASHLELQDVRFENPDNLSLWMIKRGSNFPVKYCEFYADPPKDPVLKIEHDNMMKEIQASVEKFFKAKEDYQEGMTCQG